MDQGEVGELGAICAIGVPVPQSLRMTLLEKVRDYGGRFGLAWVVLRSTQWIVDRAAIAADSLTPLLQALSDRLNDRLVRYEVDRRLSGPGTRNNLLYSLERKREAYDNYDWRDDGKEWTREAAEALGVDHVAWETNLVTELIEPYVRPEDTVLEVGPGAGRWSATLQPRCSRLILADVSPVCMDLCRKRFSDCTNVEYLLAPDGTLASVPASTIDVVWSYNVFVELDRAWGARYMREIRRVLTPGGLAVIHHYIRSPFKIDTISMGRLIKGDGFELLEQNYSVPLSDNEVVSVFRRPPPG
jgi:SAM-dependent methyltransferase